MSDSAAQAPPSAKPNRLVVWAETPKGAAILFAVLCGIGYIGLLFYSMRSLEARGVPEQVVVMQSLLLALLSIPLSGVNVGAFLGLVVILVRGQGLAFNLPFSASLSSVVSILLMGLPEVVAACLISAPATHRLDLRFFWISSPLFVGAAGTLYWGLRRSGVRVIRALVGTLVGMVVPYLYFFRPPHH